MDTVEKMKLHIKSEPEIRLEIPNPSEQLKQFTVEKALMQAFQFAQAERPSPSIHFEQVLRDTETLMTERGMTVETMPDIDIDIAKTPPSAYAVLPVKKIPAEAVQAVKEIASSYEKFNPLEEKKRHDSLEVVHEEKSGFGTTIGERMKAAMNMQEEHVVEENDHTKTGYKVDDDGTKRYKVRYKCTNNRCKLEANHYAPETVKEVKCHQCNEKMKVRRATQDAELAPDPYLNFFVAGARTPYYEFHHNK